MSSFFPSYDLLKVLPFFFCYFTLWNKDCLLNSSQKMCLLLSLVRPYMVVWPWVSLSCGTKLRVFLTILVRVFFSDMISIFLPQIPSRICFRTLILLPQSDTISQVVLIWLKFIVLELSGQTQDLSPFCSSQSIPIKRISKRVLYKSRRQFIIFHFYLRVAF